MSLIELAESVDEKDCDSMLSDLMSFGSIELSDENISEIIASVYRKYDQ